METEDVFNVAEEIKNRLTEYIPFVDFYKMSQAFLVDFVAAKGFTSVEQALHAHYICVEIKNGDNTLTGTFKDDFKLYDQVRGYEYGRTKITHHSEVKQRFFKLKFKIPSIPSTVTKMKGVEWYLCLEQDGVVTVKNHNFLANTDYLICELYAKDDFRLLGKSTMISASRHKIF
uniref:Uncharacterized protein n=1 Tax=Panagrolaimus superbus TaxID=310955 RepID=A0A914ZAX3_9BILA